MDEVSRYWSDLFGAGQQLIKKGADPTTQTEFGNLIIQNTPDFTKNLQAATARTQADLLRLAALLKNSSFHEEQEWRLVLPISVARKHNSSTVYCVSLRIESRRFTTSSGLNSRTRQRCECRSSGGKLSSNRGHQTHSPRVPSPLSAMVRHLIGRILLFFFLHVSPRGFGFLDNLFLQQPRDGVVVVHFHVEAAAALRHRSEVDAVG